MEHGYKPMPTPMPMPMPHPVAPAPVIMPPVAAAPTYITQPAPHVNVYDIHQKNVYEDFHFMPPAAVAPVVAAPVVRNDTGMVLVLFILLVIITRGMFGHHKLKC